MKDKKVLLIYPNEQSLNYWDDWFIKNYEKYVKKREKTSSTSIIELNNGVIIDFITMNSIKDGVRYDVKYTGENLELLCLRYENDILKTKDIVDVIKNMIVTVILIGIFSILFMLMINAIFWWARYLKFI